MEPKLTILLPVYNGEEYLPAALESCLGQSFGDFELLAIDDGSSDATWEILRLYARRDRRLRPVRNPRNLRLIATLNRGLALARGEYLARQDHDDLSLPGRLAAQVDFLERHPDHVLVGSYFSTMDPQDRLLARPWPHPTGDGALRAMLVAYNPFAHGTLAMRLEPIRRHGLRFDPAMLHAEDYDFYSRLMRHGRAAILPRELVRYRVHPGSVSARNLTLQHQMATRIALANLAQSPLAGRLTPRHILALRQSGEPAPPLDGPALRRRFREIRQAVAILERAFPMGHGDRRRLRRTLLSRARFALPPARRRWDRLLADLRFLQTEPWIFWRHASQALAYRLRRLGLL